ncbi:hypothetical protein FA13DRAFT_1874181 [Coprinellus micaceus]|uniref:Tropomyosin n=1 Tax=Coprinellus micaceus TaxID=71717 RepID=A0A4Y7T3N8_COPMI|nr:hypothetical protein FA13DRAFT_1874181 [Coprinellus micaceus]
MDRIRAKLADIGAERDAAFERAEKAESELRDAKLTIARYERENSDLAGKVGRLEEELDEAVAKAGQATKQRRANAKDRRIARRLRHTLPDRYPNLPAPVDPEPTRTFLTSPIFRTQTAQLAAEEAERRISGVEAEKEALEKQYETLKAKHEKVQAELAELETQLGGL